jgi:hypothetical protein
MANRPLDAAASPRIFYGILRLRYKDQLVNSVLETIALYCKNKIKYTNTVA